MKLLTPFLAGSLLMSSGLNAQPREIKSEAKITEVTVYTSGARIFSEKTLEVPAGAGIVKFTGISSEVDPGSIQVSATGQMTILSVNHEQDFLQSAGPDNAIRELENKRKTLEKKITEQQLYIQVLDKEMQFLEANLKISGTANGAKVADLMAANDYFKKKNIEIVTEKSWRNDSVTAWNEQIAKINGQIGEMQTNRNKPSGVIAVSVDAPAKTTVQFKLSYLVKNAGWFPTYDIRVKNIDEPVQLTYKANVQQNSGIDWKEVAIRFSSANPNQAGILPELTPYWLNYQAARPLNRPNLPQVNGTVFDASDNQPLPGVTVMVDGTTIGTVSDVNGRYSIAIPAAGQYLNFSFIGMETQRILISSATQNVYLQPSVQNLDEVMVVGYGVQSRSALTGAAAGVSASPKNIKIRGTAVQPNSIPLNVTQTEQQTTVEFALEKPFSVPSNGKNFQVDISTVAIPAEYSYISIPKISPAAHLKARLINWEQLNLFEGEANIYFEGAFTGKTLLDTRNFTDTLELSLGTDRNITVQRTLEKEYSSSRFLGSKSEVTKTWKIAVRNNKQQKISLTLTDQIPMTANAEIEVTDSKTDGGRVNSETGEVNWKLDLNPSERTEKKLSYTVRYPKGKKINIE